MDPFTSPKTNWSVLKSSHNKKNNLYSTNFVENRIVTNFNKKVELFNSFFAKQISIIDKGHQKSDITKLANLYQVIDMR